MRLRTIFELAELRLLGAIGIVVLLLAVAGTTQASTFVPGESYRYTQTGGLPGLYIYPLSGTEGMVTLSDNGVGGHDLAIEASVWNTVNRGAGTSLYTGVPIISNIVLTAKNNSASFHSGWTHVNYLGSGNVVGPYLGGVAPLNGRQVIMGLGGIEMAEIDLANVGCEAGCKSYADLLGIATITITGGPWVTGAVTLTGITTNVISVGDGVPGVGATLRLPAGVHKYTLSTGGGYVSVSGGLPLEAHTVTISGTNNLQSASQDGQVTMVAPMRVNTGAAISGRIPNTVLTRLKFVPEPGTLLLLVAGSVGLAVAGRGRWRK